MVSIFAPAITDNPHSPGILLKFVVSKDPDCFIGPGIMAHVICPESIDGIFNAFSYCAETGLSAALECKIDLAPVTRGEIEARRLKIRGDSLSLAVALTLIAFVERRNIKSAISATGALRPAGRHWGCHVVANIKAKICLALKSKADIMLVPAGSHITKSESPSQMTRIVTLPAIIPDATQLMMYLAHD